MLDEGNQAYQVPICSYASHVCKESVDYSHKGNATSKYSCLVKQRIGKIIRFNSNPNIIRLSPQRSTKQPRSLLHIGVRCVGCFSFSPIGPDLSGNLEETLLKSYSPSIITCLQEQKFLFSLLFFAFWEEELRTAVKVIVSGEKRETGISGQKKRS